MSEEFDKAWNAAAIQRNLALVQLSARMSEERAVIDRQFSDAIANAAGSVKEEHDA